jgi:uncharacterized protein (TIGR03118 family)
MKTWKSVTTIPLTIIPLLLGLQASKADGFVEVDLVSDLPGRAAFQDVNLVNPWGLVSSPTSPFWVADNHAGVSTIYRGNGVANSLVVTVPPAAGGQPPGAPTGVVFNGGSAFGAARFIFATEDGVIAAWSSGTTAIRAADRSASGAVYKGLAIGNNGSGNFLYAANFQAGTVDVFDTSFGLTSLSGNFTDPNLPAGYAPFNIQNFGGKLYVTYALKEVGGSDDVPGAGNGFVDVFDLNGNLVRRLISGGALNSPWGLSLASPGFGPYANDLLVGNFGDGRINVFDPATGNQVGTLKDQVGQPLEIPGLWGLSFGNGQNAGSVNDLYFAAGIPGNGALEDHGLFGRISFAVPEAGMNTALLLATALLALARFCRSGVPSGRLS